MSTPRLSLLALLLLRASIAEAAGLRGRVSEQDVEATLLAELARAPRSGATEERLGSLEAALRPMFAAVPQEADGTLAQPVVRYVLHRFFAHRHGWFIRGLEPADGAQNASAQQALGDLREWVPSYLQQFIEKLRGSRGLRLQELAVLAATLEDLVHRESVQRLEQAYRALEVPLASRLDDARARQVLEIFMMIYMLGGNFTVRGSAGVHRAHDIFTAKLKYWGRLQEWIHDVQLGIAPRDSPGGLDFNTTALVAEEVGRRYADYNAGECGTLKATLLQSESQRAGRVRLAEFYRLGLAGVFDFNEKADYLRAVGALDESDLAEPHVIVPNYVASRPNCLIASTFYVVCCRNECEDFMGSLEKRFAAETAKPEAIVEHVSRMPSATVPAPRNLSASLVRRLQGIAEKNQGSVPLHGRLFALWMHHAFPRECPYPHEAGSVSPQTPDEWMQENGQRDSAHSKEELQAHVEGDTCAFKPKGAEARAHQHLEENELPWDETEELLRSAPATTQEPAETQVPTVRRTLAPVAALSSIAFAAVVFAWKQPLRRGKAKAFCLPVSTDVFAMS